MPIRHALRQSGGGAPVLSYTRTQSRMVSLNSADDTVGIQGSGTGNTYYQSRLWRQATGNTNNFQVTSWGRRMLDGFTSPFTEGNTNTYNTSGGIEYNGVYYPFLWGGVNNKNITGGSKFQSDVLILPGNIPNAAGYWEICQTTWTAFTAGGQSRAFSALGDTYATGTGAPPALGAGALPSSGANVAVCGFNMITCKSDVSGRKFAQQGDSNTVDQSQVIDAYGRTGFCRVYTDLGSDCVKFAETGLPLIGQAAAYTTRLDELVSMGVTDWMCELGTNDVPAASAATLIAQYDALAAVIKGAGIKVHFITCPPKTQADGSTDNGASILNTSNDYLRSVAGTGNYDSYFELADIVSTARNSGVWKAGYHVGDGTHLNWGNTGVRNAILGPYKTFIQGL